MNIRSFVLAAFIIGMNFPWAGESLASVLDVPALVRSSDLIVVGRADTVAPESAANVQTFTVTVDRVLKGSTTPTGRLQVQLNLSAPGSHAMTERRYGIFFLCRTAFANVFTVTDPSFPALVASPGSIGTTATGRDPLAAVMQELLSVLKTPAATLTSSVAPVEQFHGISTTEEAQSIYHRAALALATIPSEMAGPGLRALAEVNGPAQLWAIKSLFDIESSDELEEIKIYALNSAKAALLNPEPDQVSAVYWLALSMENRLHSENAVPVLSALLASTQVVVRRAAASILSDIASNSVIAPLAASTLNDPDQQVRYFGVLGLARVASPGKGPTLAQFHQQEDEMLQHWRSWARANAP